MNGNHIAEPELALYASGDLALPRRLTARFHVSRCADCAARVEAYRMNRARLLASADELPENLDWDRLAAEMTANIRVGLAAGECVAKREPKVLFTGWRPAAVMAGAVLILSAAWFLNTPAAQTESLARAFGRILHSGQITVPRDRAPMVEVSSSGIILKQNGRAMEVIQSGMDPVAVSLSVQGSASARYIDTDTGQVTITSVYVQ